MVDVCNLIRNKEIAEFGRKNWKLSIEEKVAIIQMSYEQINTKKNYWERTKIISPTRRWEKITPKIDKKLLANFPSDFAVSYDINGHILFIGGNNIINSNTTYVYDPINNEITLSKNGTNDNMDFSDKYFYKINNKYNIALPKNLTEKNELCVVNKDDQTLIKINIDIPNDYKKTKINNPIVKKNLEFINYYGPYYSYCPPCLNRNLEYYNNLEPNQSLKLINYIKKIRGKKNIIRFKEKLATTNRKTEKKSSFEEDIGKTIDNESDKILEKTESLEFGQ